jgi:5-methylthioadenosine/S-adenosylhomocysteine deaminase
MKFVSLLHKGVATDPSLLPAPQVLAMASQGGARALGQNAGAIVPGLLADLVLVRLDRLHLQPAVAETIVTNLVHAARGSDVDTVIVDGQVVVEDGALTMVDQRTIIDRLGKIGRQLLSERASSGV